MATARLANTWFPSRLFYPSREGDGQQKKKKYYFLYMRSTTTPTIQKWDSCGIDTLLGDQSRIITGSHSFFFFSNLIRTCNTWFCEGFLKNKPRNWIETNWTPEKIEKSTTGAPDYRKGVTFDRKKDSLFFHPSGIERKNTGRNKNKSPCPSIPPIRWRRRRRRR